MTASGSSTSKQMTVAIVGGGVIGLAIAWRLAMGGARVTVYERDATGSGASHASAGMLAACAETEPGEEGHLALNRASQQLWPEFAAELETFTGLAVELRTEGTLIIALTADDQARIKHQLEFQISLGLPLQWISAAEVRKREPHLAPQVAGAIFSPEDHQVENRKLVKALLAAAAKAGASIREQAAVESIAVENGRAAGVIVAGKLEKADMVVLAAGAWSRAIEGLPPEARPPVRPVKGQMIALQMDPDAPLLSHCVWAPGAYLVPRRDGRLLVGATVEEKGFDPSLTAGAQLSLLEAAWRALPAIEELAIAEAWAGFRPGSRDDAPILGTGPVKGLIYATGHYRNGILLTPITARTIADLILHGKLDPLIRPFGLGRFALSAAAAE